jgi:hypothetical protein
MEGPQLGMNYVGATTRSLNPAIPYHTSQSDLIVRPQLKVFIDTALIVPRAPTNLFPPSLWKTLCGV